MAENRLRRGIAEAILGNVVPTKEERFKGRLVYRGDVYQATKRFHRALIGGGPIWQVTPEEVYDEALARDRELFPDRRTRFMNSLRSLGNLLRTRPSLA